MARSTLSDSLMTYRRYRTLRRAWALPLRTASRHPLTQRCISVYRTHNDRRVVSHRPTHCLASHSLAVARLSVVGCIADAINLSHTHLPSAAHTLLRSIYALPSYRMHPFFFLIFRLEEDRASGPSISNGSSFGLVRLFLIYMNCM